eukprot:6191301-Pleurochrysis_carterae.AAC.1
MAPGCSADTSAASSHRQGLLVERDRVGTHWAKFCPNAERQSATKLNIRAYDYNILPTFVVRRQLHNIN